MDHGCGRCRRSRDAQGGPTLSTVFIPPANLFKGTVARTVVLIYSPESKPLERFLFDTSGFPLVPALEALTKFEGPLDGEDGPQGSMKPLLLVDIEEQLRSVMRRLSNCQNSLGKLPEGCSFTVCVELKDEADPPIGVSQFL
jgi:mitotic spindle assembly checkpoint protein MAD2B